MTSDKNLFIKFQNDTLSHDDLLHLREQVDRLSDDEIELHLLDSAINSKGSTLSQPADESLRKRLIGEARRDKLRYTIFKRISIAAAVVAVALIGLTILLGVRLSHLNQYDGIIAQEHLIVTGKGEELLTVLPDGSRVKMAPESELKYSLSTFNEAGRNVNWSGEGLFEVTKNAGSPFTVHTDNFDVRVLGTTFSIDIRRDNDNALVYLESGSIELNVSGDNKPHRLVPGDLATISRTTGNIEIASTPDYRVNATDAMINFYDTSLKDVMTCLEHYYPRKFNAPEELLKEPFAGALPKDNMFEAITIIEKAYGMYSVTDSATVSMNLRR